MSARPVRRAPAVLLAHKLYDQVTGILKIFAVGPGTLAEAAHADSCHWAQGATFSQDGYSIDQAIYGGIPQRGWAVAPRFGEAHTALA